MVISIHYPDNLRAKYIFAKSPSILIPLIDDHNKTKSLSLHTKMFQLMVHLSLKAFPVIISPL